ncbi:10524_t:CDS:2, partial [Racocetra fulgida]
YQKFKRYNNIVIPSATLMLNDYYVDSIKYVGKYGNPFGRDIKGIFRGCCANVNATDRYSDSVRYVIFNGLKGLPGWDIENHQTQKDILKQLQDQNMVVPVVIADGIIEPFEDDVDWDSMIVRVRRNGVHIVNEILISEYEYQRQHER